MICAWCLAESGEQAKAGDSHGICEEHSAKVAAEAGMRERYVVMPERSDLAYSRSHRLGEAVRDVAEWDMQTACVRSWGRARLLDAWRGEFLDVALLREWAGSKEGGGS